MEAIQACITQSWIQTVSSNFTTNWVSWDMTKTAQKSKIMQCNPASLAVFWPHLLRATFELFLTNQEKSLLLSPNLVWSIRNTMSILHTPVWVQFISCLYCYKRWAHSEVDEMRGGPDTIYSAGRDMSPWLPNGFLHFTQLFPLRKSYRYRLPPRWPKNPQHTDTVLKLSIFERDEDFFCSFFWKVSLRVLQHFGKFTYL